MGLFGPKRPLAREELDWMLAAFQWLAREFPAEGEKSPPMILPDAAHFPAVTGTPQQQAVQFFDQVKGYMDIADWPTQLISSAAGKRPPATDPQFMLTPEHQDPAGSFQMARIDDVDVALIRYDAALDDQPMDLVATYAHELSHYLLAYTRYVFPGGDAMHELLTDVTAVWAGFGIFLANSARSFQAGFEGWSTQTSGYLSERALVTALVIREHLAGHDPALAQGYLKPYLRDDLKLAIRWFENRDVAADVANIDLSDYGADALVRDEEGGLHQ